MYIRSTAVIVLMLSGLGCHGSDYKPPMTQANGINPPAYPQEMRSSTGGRIGDSTGSTPTQPASTTAAAQTHGPSLSPPPAAGTSTPTAAPPYKPGNTDAPKSIGGGPKTETGGSVYGDGNEGNTGAIKGGGEPPK